jgi:hypothetical protein
LIACTTRRRRLPAGAVDDSRPSAPQELFGVADGTAYRLRSGIVVQKRRVGNDRVSRDALRDILRAIDLLPAADQSLIARTGIVIMVLPVAALEGGLLGATTIVQDTVGAPWRPTVVRVAAHAGRNGAEATGEIVQHEIGHVLAVLTRQDRSEAAAADYARRH